jgi:hypothetical protein
MEPSALVLLIQAILETFGPQITAVLLILGACRTVFKPACALVRAIVGVTKTDKDDKLVDAVAANKYYKAFAWLVDYLLSIKLPK